MNNAFKYNGQNYQTSDVGVEQRWIWQAVANMFDNYEIDPQNAQPDVCLSAILSENKDADNISGTLEVAIKNIIGMDNHIFVFAYEYDDEDRYNLYIFKTTA